MKKTCRPLIIDGPNMVIGTLPDSLMFAGFQDPQEIARVVGGKPGMFAFSSEICGLDAVIPDRDKTTDFQPMHLDTVTVSPERQSADLG